MSRTMERIASWQRDAGGIVKFKYCVNDLDYLFSVTQENKQAVLSSVGKLAANPACDFNHKDAAYITSLIREVMDMQPEAKDIPCSCDQCLGTARDNFLWHLMMFVCSGAAMFTLAVFVLWGAR